MGNCATIVEAEAVFVEVTIQPPYKKGQDLVYGDPDYVEGATVEYDSSRGYFKMPDGTKKRILPELANMSRQQLSLWRYENNINQPTKVRLYRALRFYKDPEYGAKERAASRENRRRGEARKY